MKKFIILVISLVLLTPLCSFGAPEKKKVGYFDITYETKDSFVMKAKMFYPTQQQEVYPLVVFLHSLGYSSDYWADFIKMFVQNGAAALVVDLRGHGQSSHDSNFKIRSWVHYTPKQFAKYPDDITEILTYVANSYKNISTTNYAIIGADIGANTAILTADKMKNKPKALALISPSTEFKGLYVPIALANLDEIPILAIASSKDKYFYNETQQLKRYAQGTYDIKSYPAGGTGMLMLKVNPNMSQDIIDWVMPLIKP